MKKTLLRSLSLCLCLAFYLNPAFCQNKLSLSRIQTLSDSLYAAKQYAFAANYYAQRVEKSDFPNQKAGAYYNMACCLSLQGKTDSALLILKKAVKAGYNKKTTLLEDTDLSPLHSLPQWNALLKSIREPKKVLNTDPTKARFITTDVHHFYEAYDKAIKDTAHFKQTIKKLYFDRATAGMNDYMGDKVSSIDYFVEHVRNRPAFYAAIRNTTMKTDTYKPAFLASFVKMKSLYDEAKFPDIYFIIGAFTSGGTATNLGLLLGVNQVAGDSKVPLHELSVKQRTRLGDIKAVPDLLAHELIHFQQDGMKNDTTTLSYAIKEGMADFIGELISGNTANPALHSWAKGKEKQTWARFTKDMYYNCYSNWIANSQNATPDNPADQGYWIGYQICKSYYEQNTDKKQAIHDMLHIQDYKTFLAKSKWEDKVASF
jgi:tetratricopeptide (TPR) repeat protein